MVVSRVGPDSDPRIYRFLYLDFERVRSLAAMLFGGVPEERVAQEQNSRRGGGKVRIGVPLLAESELGGDFLYLRSERETRALHHDLLRATVRRLEELSRIEDIDDSHKEFPDGKFVRLTGEVMIRDYLAVGEALDTLSRAYASMTKVQGAIPGARGKAKRSAQTPEAIAARETERVMRTQLPAIKESITTLFGEVIRAYCLVGATIYVASLDRTNMFEKPEPGLDPTTVGGLWTVLCDLSFGEGRQLDVSPALSEMEAAVETLIAGMRSLANILRPSEARVIRPIAIYREL